MSITFGIKTDCVKCKTLNCYCSDNPDYWDEKREQFTDKEMEDFDNVFNWIEWVIQTNGWGDEYLLGVIEDLEEYIKDILNENYKLEQLLTISQGFDPNFKSIITGESLWPMESILDVKEE